MTWRNVSERRTNSWQSWSLVASVISRSPLIDSTAQVMTEVNKRAVSPLIGWSAIIGLGIANLVIFQSHYLGNDCFPWDFWKTYYAIIPFWTTSISQHVFPEWVPFSAMGYPFFINLQSSFFYPPVWLFVLPGIHYSLHAAVIMQCLHVLWGACGAFLLLRVLTDDWRSALFGALAYQFFGGFYSNSEHMDIVRAYAWLPWLFWAATLKGPLQIRHFLLPGIFYCAATGSYPGNLVSHGLFLGIYVLYQFCQPSARSNRQHALIVGGLFALGIVLSLAALCPAFLLRSQLTRASEKLPTASWSFPDWLSLVAPWATGKAALRGYLGDPSMISAFVGIPIIVLIILISKATTKAFVAWWLLLIVGLILSLGHMSILYQMSVAIVPVLAFSRMASSDYRGLIGLALIALATVSLSKFLTETEDARRELIRKRFKYLCLLPLIVMSGVFGVSLPAQEIFWLVMIWAATVVAIYVRWPRITKSQSLSVGLLWVLVIVGGLHVISVSKWTWTAAGIDLDTLYKRNIGFSTSKWPLPVAEKIEGIPTRPARTNRRRDDFSWSGYLDGTFQIADWGNTVLKARAKLKANPALMDYMMRPLTPMVFHNVHKLSLDMVRGRLGQTATDASEQKNTVDPTRYGLNTIIYRVTLATDSVVVENEIWSPGWRGKIIRDRETVENIVATSVEKSLRAWRLPAGRYTLVTQFRTPYLRACAILSLTGLLIYVGLSAIAYRNWKARARTLDTLSHDPAETRDGKGTPQ